jgi:hypothetical protein
MKSLLLPLFAAATLSLTLTSSSHACGCGGCIGLHNPAPKPVQLEGVLRWTVEERDPRFAWDGYVGWQVVVDGIAYDLDPAGYPELHRVANSFQGRQVRIEGTLRVAQHVVGRRPGPDGRRLMDARLITRQVVTIRSLAVACRA